MLGHRAFTTLRSAREYAEVARSGDGLYVFAYGSLMWSSPESVCIAARIQCRLRGFARSFCIHSRNYRGTPEKPGLVLGLEPSDRASCVGVALKLGDPHSKAALDSLARIDAQEMITQSNPTAVYLRTAQLLQLDDGRSVSALAYVANPADGPMDLSLQQRAEVILGAHGLRGSNRDYLEQTAERLRSLGIHDPHVVELRDRVHTLAHARGAG